MAGAGRAGAASAACGAGRPDRSSGSDAVSDEREWLYPDADGARGAGEGDGAEKDGAEKDGAFDADEGDDEECE